MTTASEHELGSSPMFGDSIAGSMASRGNAVSANSAAGPDHPRSTQAHDVKAHQALHGFSRQPGLLDPSTVEQLHRNWHRDQQRIRARRGVLLALVIHLAVLLVVNALAWGIWASMDHRDTTTGAPPAAQSGSSGQPASSDWRAWLKQFGIDIRTPEGKREAAAHTPPEGRWQPPWPAWVTFGTGAALAFHVANSAPLICWKPGWNYYVVVNLALLCVIAWAIFWMCGSSLGEQWWPLIVTVVLAGTSAITTAVYAVIRKRDDDSPLTVDSP